MASRRLLILALLALAGGLAGCEATGAYPEGGGGDLDCVDIGHPVRVDGADPYGLDRDGDGVGCEGW